MRMSVAGNFTERQPYVCDQLLRPVLHSIHKDIQVNRP